MNYSFEHQWMNSKILLMNFLNEIMDEKNIESRALDKFFWTFVSFSIV